MYLQKGWILTSSIGRTAQLKKPKKFNWIWFLIWIVASVAGLVFPWLVYLIYYAVKKDKIITIQVNEAGELITDGVKPPVPSLPLKPLTPEEQAKADAASTKKILIIIGIIIAAIITIAIIAGAR